MQTCDGRLGNDSRRRPRWLLVSQGDDRLLCEGSAVPHLSSSLQLTGLTVICNCYLHQTDLAGSVGNRLPETLGLSVSTDKATTSCATQLQSQQDGPDAHTPDCPRWRGKGAYAMRLFNHFMAVASTRCCLKAVSMCRPQFAVCVLQLPQGPCGGQEAPLLLT